MNNPKPKPKVLRNVYICYVDLLGYKAVEASINKYDPNVVQDQQSKIYYFSDEAIKRFNSNYSGVEWRRYGDGYFVCSDDDNVSHLERLVKDASYLIGSQIISGIPFRVAITQGDVTVDDAPTGLTVSGKDWQKVKELEEALDWMGGWLYLPSRNQEQHDMLKSLVSITQLVVQQNHARGNQHFIAPFKKGKVYKKEHAWFLNWHKFTHPLKIDCDQQVNNWWIPHALNNQINEDDKVKIKQENTKTFADYCRELQHAASLLFFAEFKPSPDIGNIDKTID